METVKKSVNSWVYEGARLMGTLFKAFHEKTCFKIEYVKGERE